MLYSIVTLADISIGELQVLFAVAGLLSVLASVSFTLFLSSKCKSTVASLASALVFCVAPTVVSMTAPGALSTWIGACIIEIPLFAFLAVRSYCRHTAN